MKLLTKYFNTIILNNNCMKVFLLGGLWVGWNVTINVPENGLLVFAGVVVKLFGVKIVTRNLPTSPLLTLYQTAADRSTMYVD